LNVKDFTHQTETTREVNLIIHQYSLGSFLW